MWARTGLVSLWALVSIVCGCDLSVSDLFEAENESPDGGRYGKPDVDADGDTDGDSDADSDADGDADGDLDGDGDTDGDTEEEWDGGFDTDDLLDGGGADGDSDSDTDGDADGDADSDSDADTDSEPVAGAGCLIISEYVEGSGVNKGFELLNCGDEALDLSGYSVCLVTNDNTGCGSTLELAPETDDGVHRRVLGPWEVLTVCYSGAEDLGPCDLRSAVGYFNGDDRLAVWRGDELVDAFGWLEVAPDGLPWADVTLRRCDFTPFAGDTPFAVSDYYSTHGLDDYTDFGVAPDPTAEADADAGLDAGEVDDDGGVADAGAPPDDCLIISEYVEGSSWNKGVEIFNCGDDVVDLDPYALCLHVNQGVTCGITLSFAGIAPGQPGHGIEPGEVLTVCHYNAVELAPLCDIGDAVASFSGDDRLALMRGDDVVDAFGELAVRPDSSEWSDVTYRRCDLTEFGGDSAFDPAEQFGSWPKDDFDDFGVAPAGSGCDEPSS